jgi:hypothetical protein
MKNSISQTLRHSRPTRKSSAFDSLRFPLVPLVVALGVVISSASAISVPLLVG